MKFRYKAYFYHEPDCGIYHVEIPEIDWQCDVSDSSVPSAVKAALHELGVDLAIYEQEGADIPANECDPTFGAEFSEYLCGDTKDFCKFYKVVKTFEFPNAQE